MNKIYFFILSAVVLAACNSEKTSNDTPNATVPSASAEMTIAVVNVDSLLLNYSFAKTANETLVKKQEDARLNLNVKARQLQNEMEDFQNKLNNNAFLSRERAEQEGMRLQKKEADLQGLQEKLTKELMEQQQSLSKQLQDSISKAINILNEDGKYSMVLSTSSMNDNVLFVDEQYNITDAVLTLLNSRAK